MQGNEGIADKQGTRITNNAGIVTSSDDNKDCYFDAEHGVVESGDEDTVSAQLPRRATPTILIADDINSLTHNAGLENRSGRSEVPNLTSVGSNEDLLECSHEGEPTGLTLESSINTTNRPRVLSQEQIPVTGKELLSNPSNDFRGRSISKASAPPKPKRRIKKQREEDIVDLRKYVLTQNDPYGAYQNHRKEWRRSRSFERSELLPMRRHSLIRSAEVTNVPLTEEPHSSRQFDAAHLRTHDDRSPITSIRNTVVSSAVSNEGIDTDDSLCLMIVEQVVPLIRQFLPETASDDDVIAELLIVIRRTLPTVPRSGRSTFAENNQVTPLGTRHVQDQSVLGETNGRNDLRTLYLGNPLSVSSGSIGRIIGNNSTTIRVPALKSASAAVLKEQDQRNERDQSVREREQATAPPVPSTPDNLSSSSTTVKAPVLRSASATVMKKQDQGKERDQFVRERDQATEPPVPSTSNNPSSSSTTVRVPVLTAASVDVLKEQATGKERDQFVRERNLATAPPVPSSSVNLSSSSTTENVRVLRSAVRKEQNQIKEHDQFIRERDETTPSPWPSSSVNLTSHVRVEKTDQGTISSDATSESSAEDSSAPPGNVPTAGILCTDCIPPRIIKNLSGFMEHCRRKHPPEDSEFICEKCERKLKNRAALISHTKACRVRKPTS